MIHFVVTIKDRAIDTFLRPVCYPSLGAAIREFADEINNPQSPMNKHPDDYDLYHVATYDDVRGAFANTPEPNQIAIGKNAILTKH